MRMSSKTKKMIVSVILGVSLFGGLGATIDVAHAGDQQHVRSSDVWNAVKGGFWGGIKDAVHRGNEQAQHRADTEMSTDKHRVTIAGQTQRRQDAARNGYICEGTVYSSQTATSGQDTRSTQTGTQNCTDATAQIQKAYLAAELNRIRRADQNEQYSQNRENRSLDRAQNRQDRTIDNEQKRLEHQRDVRERTQERERIQQERSQARQAAVALRAQERQAAADLRAGRVAQQHRQNATDVTVAVPTNQHQSTYAAPQKPHAAGTHSHQEVSATQAPTQTAVVTGANRYTN